MAKKKNKRDPQEDYFNLQSAQLAATIANNAAQQEFLRMRFQELEKPQYQFMSEMEKERLAFQKSQQLYQEAFNEASLTGMWKGQTTTAEKQRLYQNQLSEGALTGMYNGQQTAAERNAAHARAIAESGLTGTWNGQETTDWRAQQAGITGRFNGQATMAREAMEGGQSLDLMRLQASLSGPRNALKFARNIDATGQGLKGSLAAFAGRQPMQAFGGLSGPLERNTVSGLASDIYNGNSQGYGPVPYTPPAPFPGSPPGHGPVQPGVPPTVPPPAAAGYMMGPVQPGGAGNVLPPAAAGYMMGPVQPGVPTTPPVARPADYMMGPPQPGGGPTPIAADYMMGPVKPALDYGPVPYTSPVPVRSVEPSMALIEREQMATQNAASPVSYDYAGQQAADNLYNYQPAGDGSYFSYPPGMTAPQDADQISSSVPLSTSELDKYSEGLVNPNQIDTRAWHYSTDYMKEMNMGAYEDAGWDAGYVDQLRRQAMPKYNAPTVGAFM